LQISTVTNVSLIVCTTPILTALLLSIGNRDERMTRRQKIGSLVAFAGMVLVVLNGKFALKLSPVGDLLAFVAAWAWAFYSLITKQMAASYGNLFIIRKVFFYGLLTLLPVLLFVGLQTNTELIGQPQVWLNLLFLGLVASLVCYVLWNVVMKRIGVVKASNYIYFNPVVAIITASLVIGERITLFAMLGTAMILIGMYQVERVKK
jgi:drug/metabolite transporter (DMT)-like permease